MFECPGCGLQSPVSAGPTHPSMRSSPGCWAAFGEVLAREFSDPAYFPLHQVTVDTYAGSHPGGRDRRAVQTTALHLMTLQLVLEQRADASVGRVLHKRMIERLPALTWLEPPVVYGRMTAADVLRAASAAEHLRLIRRWAEDVWAAWEPHHPTVRAWVRESLE